CTEKVTEGGVLLLTLVLMGSRRSVHGGKLPVLNSPLTTMHADGVPVGVGVGDPPPPVVPLIRYTWSGTPGSIPQSVFRRPQVRQTPKPPPGFCHAAHWLYCTVRSVQPH